MSGTGWPIGANARQTFGTSTRTTAIRSPTGATPTPMTANRPRAAPEPGGFESKAEGGTSRRPERSGLDRAGHVDVDDCQKGRHGAHRVVREAHPGQVVLEMPDDGHRRLWTG